MWFNDVEKLQPKDQKETQKNTSEVSDNAKVDKMQATDQTTKETEISLIELQKRIQQMKASKEYNDEDLENLEKDILAAKNNKEVLERKAKQLDSLAKKKDQTTENPSLWRRFRYGSFLGNMMDKIGWESWKERADKKLHEKKDTTKRGFRGKVGDAFLFAGAFLLGKKTLGKLQDWFAEKFGDEKKDKKPDQPKTVVDTGQTDVAPQDQNHTTPDNNLGAVLEDDKTNQPPLQHGEQSEIDKAIVEEDKLRGDGVNDLYILSRLLGMGFVPSNLYRRRPARFMTNAPWNFKVALSALLPSMRERVVREKAYLISQWVNQYDYDAHLNKLSALEQDIKTGKITSFDQIKKNYPDLIDTKPSRIEKLLRDKKSPLKRVKKEAETKIETLQDREQAIRQIDGEMKSLQKEAAAKYKALEDLDKAAVKDPAKKKQLQVELEKITKDFQRKQAELYKKTGVALQGVSNSDIVKLQRYQMVDHLVKNNGGRLKLIEKINGRGGRIMMRVGLAGLFFRAADDIADQGILSKETALDAADLGIWLIPVAGGIYDLGMAIYGKDLNGRQMSTADRRIRWTVWVGTAVLDLFSFGVAGTAVRAWVKTTTRVVKIVNKTVDAEKAITRWLKIADDVYKGTKVVTHGVMLGGLTYGVAINAYDLTIALKDGSEPVIEEIKANNTDASKSIT